MLRICKNNLGLDFVRHLDDTTPAGQICWQVWTENQMPNATPIQWIISCCDVSAASVHLVLSKLWMSVLMSLIRMQLLAKAQLMFHLESVETAGVLIASRVLTMLIQSSSIFNVSNSRAHLGSCESGSSVSSKSRKASQQICAHGKHSSSGPISCVIQHNGEICDSRLCQQ